MIPAMSSYLARSSRAVALLAAALALVTLVAACGGGGGGGVNSFADGTCKDLSDWGKVVVGEFKTISSIDTSELTSTADAQGVLDQLSSALDKSSKATDTMVDNLESRDAPDVKNGDKAKTVLIAAFKSFGQTLQETKKKVDDFDVQTATPDDAQQFSQDLSTVGDELGKAFEGFGSLSNSDLENAFNSRQACKDAQASFS
jgi:hypothetical protein